MKKFVSMVAFLLLFFTMAIASPLPSLPDHSKFVQTNEIKCPSGQIIGEYKFRERENIGFIKYQKKGESKPSAIIRVNGDKIEAWVDINLSGKYENFKNMQALAEKYPTPCDVLEK